MARPDRIAGALAAAALLALAMPAAARPPTAVIRVALCGGGTADIPLPGKRERTGDCAMACHAPAERRRAAGCGTPLG